MTPTETAAILRRYNSWRRGNLDRQPDPREIGEAINAAVEMIERLEALRAELKAAHAMALNGVELKELAQKYEAEIEEMKQQEPIAWTTQLALELGNSTLGFDACRGNLWGDKGVPLYVLPGAKGEEK